jgi:hypothetical protein
LLVSARFRSTMHMYQYLTNRLAGLSGISSVETSPTIAGLSRPVPLRAGSAADVGSHRAWHIDLP